MNILSFKRSTNEPQEDVKEIVMEYLDIKNRLKGLTKQKSDIEKVLTELIGDDTELKDMNGDIVLTRKLITTWRIDNEKVKKLDNYNDLIKETSYYRFFA